MKKFLPLVLIAFALCIFNFGRENVSFAVDLDSIREDLRLYLPMDDDVFDYSGLANHGTNFSGVYVPGKVGSAISLTAPNAYVAVRKTDNFNSRFLNNNFSISFWGTLYANTDYAIFSQSPYGGIALKFIFGVFNGGSAFGLHGWTSTPSLYEFKLPFYSFAPEAGLQHYVITRNGNDFSLYRNGVFVSTVTQSFAIEVIEYNFELGRAESSMYYKNTLDEFALWNRALALDEIAYLYNSGNGVSLKKISTYAGSGTAIDPYVVTTCEQLQDMNYYVSSHFILGNDIDCSDTVNWQMGMGFAPIGQDFNRFTGSFDGKGYEISGLYLNRNDFNGIGLFGVTQNSVLKNVFLTDVTIYSTYRIQVGALVGRAINTQISNVYSTGNIYTSGIRAGGGWQIGGVAGNLDGSTLSSCASIVNIGISGAPLGATAAAFYRGGLVGRVDNSTVTDSYARGVVEGNNSAGFSGYVNLTGIIQNSYSTGLVFGPTAPKGFNSTSEVGSTFTNSYWDMDTSTLTTSGGGDGKSTLEMKDPSTFSTWDFINVWRIDEKINEGYPYLPFMLPLLPQITSISNVSLPIGYATFDLTVSGTRFRNDSVVKVDNVPLATTYIDANTLKVTIPAGAYLSGSHPVSVYNVLPFVGHSNEIAFVVDNTVPVLTSITPTSKYVGEIGFTMTLSGSDFLSGVSVVRFAGFEKVTRFIDANTLEADIPASDLLNSGNYNITVYHSLPGGGESSASVFSVLNPVPAISTISPVSTVQNSGDFVLTVYGVGFSPSSIVRFNGSDRATTYIDSGTLTANIFNADISSPGNKTVEVFSPLPGGGLSGGVSFTVNSSSAASSSSSGGVVILPYQLSRILDVSGLIISVEDESDLKSTNIKVNFSGGSDVYQYIVSEDPNFKGARWLPYSSSIDFVLSPELGKKTIYFRFRNSLFHTSPVVFKDVYLSDNAYIENFHNSADEPVFSKISMSERVLNNLKKNREKRLIWEQNNKIETNVGISYEISENSILNFAFDRFLGEGASGEDVKNLQIILTKLGYFAHKNGTTGYFGTVTKSALIEFQIDNGIKPSLGIMALSTRDLLNKEYLYLLN